MNHWQLSRISIVAFTMVLAFSFTASAAKWSQTTVEFLYGTNYEKRNSFEDDKGMILTLSNATSWEKGDSYFFLDVGDAEDIDGIDGIHLEWGLRLSLLRAFGKQPLDGFFKDVYFIAQADIDAGNSFTNKVTPMAGISADWNVPGFLFFKTHLQYRDDPKVDGDSAQFNIVWNRPFEIGGQKFSFEGFMDYTLKESDSSQENQLLIQPQLLWHATKHIADGVEYLNLTIRVGLDGVDENVPQIMARWTF